LYITVLAAFLFFSIKAQPPQRERPNIQITGKVMDQNTEAALEYATIAIISSLDSAVVAGAITDENGMFQIQCQAGKLFAKIDFLSYEQLIIDKIPMERGKLNVKLGNIYMNPSSTLLDEIEVIGEKSMFQVALDKKVFNVGTDMTISGGNAEDVLNNVPSVVVDIEGSVSLRGSENVNILVDGQPSSLVSGQYGLRMLQATEIEKVEVITNPSARYDAEGTVGIINIILKEQRKKGFNGLFSANVGYPKTIGLGTNLNYRYGKFNFFTNANGGQRTREGGGFYQTEYFSSEGSTFLDQDRDQTRQGLYGRVTTGIDYFPDQNSKLTLKGSYRASDNENMATLSYEERGADNQIFSLSQREEKELEDSYEYSVNASLDRDFKGKDHNLKINLRRSRETETEDSDYNETYDLDYDYPDTGVFIQESLNEEDELYNILSVDYKRPLKGNAIMELGSKATLRSIANDYHVNELIDGNWERLSTLSNSFSYDENVYAAYGIYGKKFDKFSYQLGLRYEYTDLSTYLKEGNDRDNNQYGEFFPSAHLTYSLSEENAIQVSYSRRVRRPRFRHLNPFWSYSDSRSIRSGNPKLDPEFSHIWEIGYVRYLPTGSLSTSVYYNHMNDVIRWFSEADENGIIRSSPINLATSDSYGMEFSFSQKLFQWLSFNGNANIFHYQTAGDYKERNYEASSFSWMGRGSLIARSSKLADLQMSLRARGPMESGQGRRDAMIFMSVGFARDILNGSGTLNLSIRDPFNTAKRSYETQESNFTTVGEYRWSSRSFNLSFVYRVNQKKQRSGNGGNGESEGGDEMEF
jgi:outer membrane cobalamin receptor